MSSGPGKTSSTRPIAYENGNWICDDPACANVNYPRRSECNRCGRVRGPAGDAVVEAFMMSRGLGGSSKRPRDGLGMHEGIPGPGPYAGGGGGGGGGYIGGPPTSFPLPPGPQMQPMPLIQIAAPQQPQSNPAAEGKRIAEHLLNLFAVSEDPFSDASDCLASATLWLHSLKPPRPAAPTGSMNGAGYAGAAYAGATFGSPMGPGGPMQMGMSQGGLLYAPGPVLVQGPPGGMPQQMPVTRVSRPVGVKFEDYKDKPSDYLNEYGDPAINLPSRGQPTPGVKWQCEKCSNVNYPRRTHCKTCNERRGAQGEEIVREYVRHLIEG